MNLKLLKYFTFGIVLLTTLGGILMYSINRNNTVDAGRHTQKEETTNMSNYTENNVSNKDVSTQDASLLNVDGKDMASKYVKLHENYAELPLVEILTTIGFNIKWIDDDVANITRDNKNYILDLSKKSLTKAKSNNNLLLRPPGTHTYTCEILEKEIVLDSVTFKGVMYLMGIQMNIEVRNTDSKIYIKTGDG